MKKAGQIAVFKFPTHSIDAPKPRPCLLLNRLPGPYNDWLVAMISTQIHQCIDGMDEIVDIHSSDFLKSGLRTESLVRITRLTVAEESILIGAIGELSAERLKRIKNNLANWIKSD